MPLKIFEKVSPFLRFQTTVVAGLGRGLATVTTPHQTRVGAAHRPAGADGQLRIELTLDLADIESDAECRSGEGGSEADGQRQFRQAPVGCCFCHRRYSIYFCYGCLDYSQRVLLLDPSKV